ncbi:MAG: thioredoxin fold domain-containing protein [Terrimonas sp.]|nr:thioredoxin fold domain-containing protein [Terrimonas sp.]
MKRRSNSFFIFLLIMVSTLTLPAQETDTVFTWKTSSTKLAEGKYELIFSTPGSGNWELFEPNQELSDIRMGVLTFPDSSVNQVGGFSVSGDIRQVNSPVFGNVSIIRGAASWKAVISIAGTVPASLQGALQFYYGKGDEFYAGNPYTFKTPLEGGINTAFDLRVKSIDINKPVNDCGDDGTKNKSLFTIFLLGLVGGLIALLTPCVFPMIPVTVTFFTKKSQDKKKGVFNAVMYGLFIFLIYILITLPFHIAGNTNPEIFNNISTNIWLNLVFFAVFVLFALSFFGLFEIGLPAGLANKADAKSGLGNIAGIFFMAATLAIVSFSCTGPILGTLLVGVAEQGAWPLTAGAAGFGLALGLPFALFAMFPNWLHSLPKSGGWMTDVKVVLGFIELALAVKFLSNADLVEQWGFIKREIFIGAWVLIGLFILLYLTGKLKMSHSTPVKKYSFTRIFFIILFTLMTAYLIPGITNTKWANLKLISGFPPPMCYSLYNEPVNCKRGFKPLENDYLRALERGRNENKPVLIDFTGWACVNCRKMEESVWTDPVVDSLMKKEFVVVSLYVDERKNLPLTEQTVFVTASGKNKPIITVGDKWATFQTENFGATSQPQYAIINSQQRALTRTKFYTPDAEEFAAWLTCGLEAFKKGKE